MKHNCFEQKLMQSGLNVNGSLMGTLWEPYGRPMGENPSRPPLKGGGNAMDTLQSLQTLLSLQWQISRAMPLCL